MKLVEREALLQQLEARLDDVRPGNGHVLLVGGEAGVGKSALVLALAERRGDAAFWLGACDALQTPHPLAPLQDIARGNDVAFGAMLDAGANRAGLFEAVLAELSRATRATLLVIEDVHWADDATLDLLKFLGRRIERVPCLLLATYRDDEVTATHPLRQLMGVLPRSATTRIEVPRLSAAGVELLARSALRTGAGLYAITQGNPFFVTEMLRQSVDGVPHAVQDLVLARFSGLSPAAQAVLRLVAIVPARIERWLVERLLAPQLATLEECLNCGLLLAAPATLQFRHELARVAVETAQSIPAAQALHAAALAALEAHDATEISLARLVHHAARAADADAVLRLAPAAALQASQRGAHKEAAAHLNAALAYAGRLPGRQRAELFDRLSYECYLTDRIGEAIIARNAALSCWQALGDALKCGDARRWLSRLCWYNGDSVAAEEHGDGAIDILAPLPPGRELAMAYSNRSQLHMLAGRCAQARAWGKKALALAAALGDLEIEIHALNNIGTARMDDGDEGGRADIERSLALALAHRFDEHAARAFTNLSYSAVLAHETGAAQDYLARGIAFCEEHDLDSWSRYMGAYRSELALMLGDWDSAAEQAQMITQSHIAPISRIAALTTLGRLHARRGTLGAQAALDEALALALPTKSFMRIGPVAAARAEAAWLRGDLPAVAAEARRGYALATERGYLSWVMSELAYWLHCAGALEAMPLQCAEPFALQIAGRWSDAVLAWQRLGYPYERARAASGGDAGAQREALAGFERLGAQVDAERLRKALQAAGVRGLPRGARATTQANPHALTQREIQILRLLCAGLRNAQIAGRLSRSVRTVDHHVAAIFAKLGVATRTEAMAAALAAGIRAEK